MLLLSVVVLNGKLDRFPPFTNSCHMLVVCCVRHLSFCRHLRPLRRRRARAAASLLLQEMKWLTFGRGLVSFAVVPLFRCRRCRLDLMRQKMTLHPGLSPDLVGASKG